MIAEATAHSPVHSVSRLCALLGVNRSWYYARASAPTQQERDFALRERIEQSVLAFPGCGTRRVTRQRQRDGWAVNHKRVLRVMRAESLLCQLKRRFVPTADAGHDWRTYPNLLPGTALTVPDQAWVADLTNIRLLTAFVYRAAILEACSRRCVGWARGIATRLILVALEMALRDRQPARGFVHHADRGVQYASGDDVARREAASAQSSMSATGNPYDNTKAERFFKSLKNEAAYLKEYRTVEAALLNLEAFIEDVYITKRLHSSLGGRPPAEFEAALVMSAGS